MKPKLTVAAAIALSVGAFAFAHRLDEYLQATIISIEKDRVQAFMRLIPGVAVSSAVIASIDTNADGVISETEQQIYAERVLRDLVQRSGACEPDTRGGTDQCLKPVRDLIPERGRKLSASAGPCYCSNGIQELLNAIT
jgi:hypothetical protein